MIRVGGGWIVSNIDYPSRGSSIGRVRLCQESSQNEGIWYMYDMSKMMVYDVGLPEGVDRDLLEAAVGTIMHFFKSRL